jgi:hypothetical protein
MRKYSKRRSDILQQLKFSIASILTLTASILLAIGISSCEEKLSPLGSEYVRDTVTVNALTLAGNDVCTYASLYKPTLDADGITYAANYASPYLFIGKADNDALKSWAVIKAPFPGDTIGTVRAMQLTLSIRNAFMYGDAIDNTVDFSVYIETKGKVTDSLTSLSKTDLSAQPVGTFQSSIIKDSLTTITIDLDSAMIAPYALTASLAFVIVPNAPMKCIRGFASRDNSDSAKSPFIHYITVKDGVETDRAYKPVYDFHILTDNVPAAPSTFVLRGSSVQRERIVLDIKTLRQRYALDDLTTINTCLLEFTTEPEGYRTSFTPTDTVAPILAQIYNIRKPDSLFVFQSYGIRSDSNANVFLFQCRAAVEEAIRTGADSVVFELRTGFSKRIYTGIVVYMEDYHTTRWAFYDMSAADITKRPKVHLTYSRLKQ